MRIAPHAGAAPYRPLGAGRLDQAAPATHALLRLVAALLIMQHGMQKLLGWLGGAGEAGGTVPLLSMMGLAGVLELFGGALILVGLLTRPVALVLMVEMIIAYVVAHLPQGGFPVQNQGELALLYAVVFAFLSGNGAGPLSIDGWLARRRSREVPRPSARAPSVAPSYRHRRRDTAA